jgi:PHP family Zn ribbon phosphoesterase
VPCYAPAITRMGKGTTKPGYVNKNGQVVIYDTGKFGTDHLQYVYKLGCSRCGEIYGANGADIFERKCPKCGGGEPGLLL